MRKIWTRSTCSFRFTPHCTGVGCRRLATVDFHHLTPKCVSSLGGRCPVNGRFAFFGWLRGCGRVICRARRKFYGSFSAPRSVSGVLCCRGIQVKYQNIYKKLSGIPYMPIKVRWPWCPIICSLRLSFGWCSMHSLAQLLFEKPALDSWSGSKD